MIRYLETLFRHRVVLLGVLGLGIVTSVLVGALQPKTYESSASLYFDQSSPASGNLTPADQQTAVLKQFLQTRSFCIDVGNRGPLAAHLAAQQLQTNVISDWVPPLRRLFGVAQPLSQQQLGDLIEQTLQKQVTVNAAGPQVVVIKFKADNARVAAETVAAIIAEFTSVLATDNAQQAASTVALYTNQVAAQETVLAQADSAVTRYLGEHPEQRSQVAPDPTLLRLRQIDDEARQRYTALLQKLDDANAAEAALKDPAATAFRVLDRPEAPMRATGALTQLLFAAGAGIGGSVTVILVGVVLLTLLDKTVRRTSDVDAMLGLTAVGAIPMLPSSSFPAQSRPQQGRPSGRRARAAAR